MTNRSTHVYMTGKQFKQL